MRATAIAGCAARSPGRPSPASSSSRTASWSGRKDYRSSEGVLRRFCGTCGSSLTFEAEGIVFLALGSLDHPERVAVDCHTYTGSKLPGIKLADGLPQFPGPAGGKGGRPIE